MNICTVKRGPNNKKCKRSRAENQMGQKRLRPKRQKGLNNGCKKLKPKR
jgi:hypothetical protein